MPSWVVYSIPAEISKIPANSKKKLSEIVFNGGFPNGRSGGGESDLNFGYFFS